MPRDLRASLVLPLSIAAILSLGCWVRAQTVWSGLTHSFTKPAGTDGTLPQYQDPLTANVVLTRGSSGGMINIAAESFFDLTVSPKFTEWATNLNNATQTISATNWQNLTFSNWINSYGGSQSGGSSIAGRDAVVHIIPENIYLDLRFSSWTAGGGGGYAYMRAEAPAVLTPTGDYNGNQIVDAADYVVWRDTLSQTVSPFGSGADGDSSGTIDSDDYGFWRARFGNATGSGSATAMAVPEPSALSLGLLVSITSMCSISFGCVRRKHSTSLAQPYFRQTCAMRGMKETSLDF